MRAIGLALSASILLPALLVAQEAGKDLSVKKAVMARTMEEREPAGEATAFPRDVGQIVCFTRLDAPADTVIYHVWRHGETLHAKVQLSVGAGSWRTWSRKRIHPSWTGDWTVDIEDETGEVLETLRFTIGGVEETRSASE